MISLNARFTALQLETGWAQQHVSEQNDFLLKIFATCILQGLHFLGTVCLNDIYFLTYQTSHGSTHMNSFNQIYQKNLGNDCDVSINSLHKLWKTPSFNPAVPPL